MAEVGDDDGAADDQGDVFMSIFTTFGSFSIVAGILLIFLIFVMLSAERRTELGIARAGTFSCLLGTSGLSAPGTQPMQLNRVAAEPDVYAQIFGRPICQWLLSQPT